jgi:hypothetical protein
LCSFDRSAPSIESSTVLRLVQMQTNKKPRRLHKNQRYKTWA